MATNNDSLRRQIVAIEEGLSILKSALENGGYKRESIHIIAGCIIVANLFLGEKYPLSNTLDIQSMISYLQRAHTALQQTYLQQITAVPAVPIESYMFEHSDAVEQKNVKAMSIESHMFALKGALEQKNIHVASPPHLPLRGVLKPPSDVPFCSPALTPAATENTTTPTTAQLSAVKNALEQKNFQVGSLPQTDSSTPPTIRSSYQFYSPVPIPFATENIRLVTAIQPLKEDPRPMSPTLRK